MRNLFESGLRHVEAGHTTIDELLRVTEIPADDAPRDTGGATARRLGGSAAGRGVASRQSGAAPAGAKGGVAEEDALLGFDLLENAAGDVAAPAAVPEGKGTVLLVEDEDSLRLVIRDLLEREGYRVAEAVDGVQALDQVDRVAPDALILDLNLPRLDGYSVLQQLRSRPQTADLLVMVLTAKGDEDNEVKVFELGADDFLQKPFRARALAARLDALLARRKPPS
jgi:CheY-like chemotaxis protein